MNQKKNRKKESKKECAKTVIVIAAKNAHGTAGVLAVSCAYSVFPAYLVPLPMTNFKLIKTNINAKNTKICSKKKSALGVEPKYY